MVTEQGRTMTMPAKQTLKCADSGISRCVTASEEYRVYIRVRLWDDVTIRKQTDRQTEIGR